MWATSCAATAATVTWVTPDNGAGTSGVREPRRPMPGTNNGGAELELPRATEPAPLYCRIA